MIAATSHFMYAIVIGSGVMQVALGFLAARLLLARVHDRRAPQVQEGIAAVHRLASALTISGALLVCVGLAAAVIGLSAMGTMIAMFVTLAVSMIIVLMSASGIDDHLDGFWDKDPA